MFAPQFEVWFFIEVGEWLHFLSLTPCDGTVTYLELKPISQLRLKTRVNIMYFVNHVQFLSIIPKFSSMNWQINISLIASQGVC